MYNQPGSHGISSPYSQISDENTFWANDPNLGQKIQNLLEKETNKLCQQMCTQNCSSQTIGGCQVQLPPQAHFGQVNQITIGVCQPMPLQQFMTVGFPMLQNEQLQQLQQQQLQQIQKVVYDQNQAVLKAGIEQALKASIEQVQRELSQIPSNQIAGAQFVRCELPAIQEDDDEWNTQYCTNFNHNDSLSNISTSVSSGSCQSIGTTNSTHNSAVTFNNLSNSTSSSQHGYYQSGLNQQQDLAFQSHQGTQWNLLSSNPNPATMNVRFLGGTIKQWADFFKIEMNDINFEHCKYYDVQIPESSYAPGGKHYDPPPIGSIKIALNTDKLLQQNILFGSVSLQHNLPGYDRNKWLQNDSDSWPIGYHGTKLENVASIVKSGYKSGHGRMYGTGVYAAKYIRDALMYSRDPVTVDFVTIPYENSNNKTYKVVIMNRLRRDAFCQTKDEPGSVVDYYRCPTANIGEQSYDIRPYAILLVPVKNK